MRGRQINVSFCFQTTQVGLLMCMSARLGRLFVMGDFFAHFRFRCRASPATATPFEDTNRMLCAPSKIVEVVT